MVNQAADDRQKIYKRKVDIISRKIAGEFILVPIKGKLVDMQRIFMMDEVGEFIWNFLENQHSLAEIISEIEENFTVSKSQAETEISEFVRQLLQADIILEIE
jgi:hypothetical protein